MASLPSGPESRAQLRAQPSVKARAWKLLLVVPLIGTLIPPIYNVKDPVLFSIPFFYWYQMVWIPISVLITVIVYRAIRETR